jgi:hypothetical protein
VIRTQDALLDLEKLGQHAYSDGRVARLRGPVREAMPRDERVDVRGPEHALAHGEQGAAHVSGATGVAGLTGPEGQILAVVESVRVLRADIALPEWQVPGEHG